MLRIPLLRALLVLAATTLAAWACSESATSIADVPSAEARWSRWYEIDDVSGENQTGPAGAELAAPIVVRVVDRQGQPSGGRRVYWKIQTGEGSLREYQSTTKPDGTATNWWTLGGAIGVQAIEVRPQGGRWTTVQATATEPGSGTDPGPEPDGQVAAISVSPSELTLTSLGEARTLSATARDASGSQVSGVTFAWRSTRSGVATVNSSGRVTAAGNGTAQVIVTQSGVSGGPADTVAITVRQEAAGVVVTPASLSLVEGNQASLQATVKDALGSTISGASVNWRSRNSGVATVNGGGTVSAAATGSTTIEASSGGAMGTSGVTVEGNSGSADLLFSEDFENGIGSLYAETCCTYSYGSSNDARAGNQSVRVELRQSDPMVHSGMRSELTILPETGITGGIGAERWFGFSLKPSANWRVDDNLWVVVSQWHAEPDPGESWGPPPMQLNITGSQWELYTRWDAEPITQRAQQERRWLGEVAFGEWTDWVVHVKWEYDDTGLVEIWRNGQKIVERRGPIGFNDQGQRYFAKLGAYIPQWNNTTGSQSRVINVDSWKVADENGSYADVAPGR